MGILKPAHNYKTAVNSMYRNFCSLLRMKEICKCLWGCPKMPFPPNSALCEKNYPRR